MVVQRCEIAKGNSIPSDVMAWRYCARSASCEDVRAKIDRCVVSSAAAAPEEAALQGKLSQGQSDPMTKNEALKLT